jgi:hypothetical protein
MNMVKTIDCVILFIIGLFLSSLLSPFSTKVAEGQIACPVGFQRNILGTCEPVTNLQTCPVGYQRSASGICVPVTNLQTCPVGYQRSASGICVPVTNLQTCPVGFQTIPPGICVPIAGTGSNLYPQTAFNQPQQTFTQPSSSNVPTASPTLTKQSAGQLSEWFPSLPAIACGGTSTMTTIGSVERDNGGDAGGDNGGDNDDDKDYALQIKSDGGPSADPESVDGRIFAGDKNIERNNGKDFDIKNVFNDCQVSMFDD